MHAPCRCFLLCEEEKDKIEGRRCCKLLEWNEIRLYDDDDMYIYNIIIIITYGGVLNWRYPKSSMLYSDFPSYT